MSSTKYIPYSNDVEKSAQDEQESINGIIKAMTGQSKVVAKREDHAFRASHAKSTGLVTGKLEIMSNLAPELAQGLFAKPGIYDVAVRYAQGPGEILHDKVSVHRGMSVKIFGVEGAKLKNHNADTQDFVFASGPVFPSGTAAGFLRDEKMLRTATPAPEMLKSAVSTVARAVNAVTESITGAPPPVADFFGHPFTHPLSEPYYSQAPYRYGDYVAKLGAFPVKGPTLETIKNTKIDTSKDENAFRTAVTTTFGSEDIVWEIKVQLWTDEKTQPLEDSSVQWPESESPYRTVAILTIPKQNAYSTKRQQYFDDVLSFRPAHSLKSMRPLGSIMRTRMQVYSALSEYRHKTNQVQLEEPTNISQIPA